MLFCDFLFFNGTVFLSIIVKNTPDFRKYRTKQAEIKAN